jgi:hypothetical protein
MDVNPYEPPQEPNEKHRRRALLAVFAPLALPAAAVALCTMCTANGVVQSSPLGTVRWWAGVSTLAVAGITFVGTLVYFAVRRLRG